MQPEIEKEVNCLTEDEFLKQFLSTSESDFLLNSEITQREYFEIRNKKAIFFKNYPLDFCTWIKEGVSFKFFLIYTTSFAALTIFLYNLFNFEHFMFFIISYGLLFLFIMYSAPSFLKLGAFGLFKKFNISIKSKKNEDLVKLLSLTSMLVNNSLIDRTEEAKLDILKSVSNSFKKRDAKKAVNDINDLFCEINENECNLKNYGFKNQNYFEAFLNKSDNLKDAQNKMLSLFVSNPSSKLKELDMRSGFVNGLLDSKIDEDDASTFLSSFEAQFKKKFVFNISFYTGVAAPLTWAFSMMILSFSSLYFFSSVFVLPDVLASSIAMLLAIFVCFLSIYQYMRINDFFNSILDNGVANKYVNANINKMILLSIVFNSKDAKELLTKNQNFNTLKKIINKFNCKGFIDALEDLSIISNEASKRNKNQELEISKRLKSTSCGTLEVNNISIENKNVSELILSAKKDILFPGK